MITSTPIAKGDCLGARLSSLTSLLFLQKRTGQQLVFFNEYLNKDRGLQFYKSIDIAIPLLDKPIVLNEPNMAFKNRFLRKINNVLKRFDLARICRNRGRSAFIVKNDLADTAMIDSRLFLLEKKGRNYDIRNGFGTFRAYESEIDYITSLYQFKREISDEAEKQIKRIRDKFPGKQLVSLHMRKKDYLDVSSLNLSKDYYADALDQFPSDDYVFLLFSDDIALSRTDSVLQNIEFECVEGNSAEVDFCMMSLCDHNITANASFSLWDAVLNKNPRKKVVCSWYYIEKRDLYHQYMNGERFPEDWIVLKKHNGNE